MAGLSVSRLIRVRCALATGLRIEVRAGIPSRPGRPRGSTCQLLRAQIARMTSEASGAHAPLGDQILETGQLPFRFLPPPQHPSTLARLRPAPPLLFRRFRKGTTPFSRKERERGSFDRVRSSLIKFSIDFEILRILIPSEFFTSLRFLEILEFSLLIN